jgi:hypothetical protein
MADASYVRSSFISGEWSKLSQGGVHRPEYPFALNVCLNGLPLETGAWVRRPGTRVKAVSRGGVAARTQRFDFKQTAPYDIEFTDGFLRFFANNSLATTNDQKVVASISAANPAKVATTLAHGWATGNTTYFNSLGVNNPLLHNRPFLITVTSATEFTIADAVTGANIDGATLGAFVSGNVTRVLEIVSPYAGGTWATLRVIRADIPIQQGTTPGAVTLNSGVAPYVLKVVSAPTASAFATFTLSQAVFKDGPYLDAFINGALATPSALSGIINLTLSFNAWDATRAYTIGDYVSSGGINYKSIADANFNHAPPNASFWVVVTTFDPIGPNGFQGTDFGRMVRLYSEPPIWDTAVTYAANDVVAYGGAGLSYTGATYWKSLVGGNAGNTPGTDLTKWALFPTGAIWSWGKITALLNEIDRALAGSASIGDLTSGGGLAAAFDGDLNQTWFSSIGGHGDGTAANKVAAAASIAGYIGKNYSGATDQKIQQATLFPATDIGLAAIFFGIFHNIPGTVTVTVNLRAKASAPASGSDGTLLGTTGVLSDILSAVTITSNDQVTAWKYVWFEILATGTGSGGGSPQMGIGVAEAKFFNPPGGASNGVQVQILGDKLLYTSAVRTWRLGLYSNTTGWPTCGTYHEGRLWLAGLVSNRFDGSRSNDIFNFAPTETGGTVSPSNGISYAFNSADVNLILWMEPDQLGIVAGTGAGEWLIQASALNQPLTPTSIQAHRATAHKCANIEPRRTGLTLAVVQAFRRSLLEFFHDVYSGKFAADNLAEHAKHLTNGNIAELAFQHELTPIIWIRRTDGVLVGITYRRKTLVSSQPAEMRGWHRHVLGSGRTVEYISAGSSAGGSLDALTLVTNDAATGVRHIEGMSDILDEGATLVQASYLDDALPPDAVSSSPVTPAPYGGLTLFGLWPLNGKTVSAWLGGLDCGDYTVANGQITVPYGDGVSAGTASGLFTAAFASTLSLSQMLVGFTFTSDGQIVRANAPAESGARNGPGFGKLRRNHYYAIQVEGAVANSISVGTEFTTSSLKPMLTRFKNGTAIPVNQQFTGIHKDNLADEDDFDGMICWRVTRPYPANIAAIGGFLQTKDS